MPQSVPLSGRTLMPVNGHFVLPGGGQTLSPLTHADERPGSQLSGRFPGYVAINDSITSMGSAGLAAACRARSGSFTSSIRAPVGRFGVPPPTAARCRRRGTAGAHDQDAWRGAVVEGAEAALDWYSSHFMYTSYLAASPHIVWWRSIADRDMITVGWRHTAEHGLDCTVPRQGQASVPTELFLRAVEEFDRELIDAIDQRITEIEAHGLDPDTRLDLEQLRHEHRQRSRSLATTLQHVPATDWTAVREGVTRILSTRTPKPPSVATDPGHWLHCRSRSSAGRRPAFWSTL